MVATSVLSGLVGLVIGLIVDTRLGWRRGFRVSQDAWNKAYSGVRTLDKGDGVPPPVPQTIRWSMGKGDGVTYISRTLPRCLDTKLYDFARIATCYAASAGNINLRVLDSKPNREAYVDPWPHLYKPDHRPRRDGELTFPSEPEERVQMLALAGGYTVKAIEYWRRGPALKE